MQSAEKVQPWRDRTTHGSTPHRHLPYLVIADSNPATLEVARQIPSAARAQHPFIPSSRAGSPAQRSIIVCAPAVFRTYMYRLRTTTIETGRFPYLAAYSAALEPNVRRLAV